MESSYPLFVAMDDYVSRTDEDLGFKKGELLYVLDTTDGDWWFARAKHSSQKGYVPSYILTEYNPLGAEE